MLDKMLALKAERDILAARAEAAERLVKELEDALRTALRAALEK